jgi:hypothetical protein
LVCTTSRFQSIEAENKVLSKEKTEHKVKISMLVTNLGYRFRGSLHTKKSGFLGYTLRILPNHSQAVTPFIPLLITWASESSVHAPELALK